MNRHRRNFIKTVLALPALSFFLKPLLALAEWNSDAFSADNAPSALAQLFPGREIIPHDKIAIGVESLVENGAVVPVKVNTDLPKVASITILVEKNPNPLIAHFELSPECKGFIATRIKVAEPSNITAVVQSAGKLYSASQFVEVVEGGCG